MVRMIPIIILKWKLRGSMLLVRLGIPDTFEAPSMADDGSSKQSWSLRALSESSVACTTGDYAMQNVIFQMGLRLLAPGGMQIRQLKTWILQCHACYTLTPELGRDFCPKCGNGGTLRKGAVTIGENGTIVFHYEGPKDAITKNLVPTASKVSSSQFQEEPYTYGVELHGLAQSFIREGGVARFRSDPWNTKNDAEEGSDNLTYVRYNLSVTSQEVSYVFRITNHSFFSILRIDNNGQLKRSTWLQARKLKVRTFPDDACGGYNLCGANALCDRDNSPNCRCVTGFQPRDEESWGFHDWTGGCVRKTPLNCFGDRFVRLIEMKLPDASESIVDRRIRLKECRDKCLGNCNCTAYANTDMQNGGSGCVIWVGGLLDLRKNNFAGQDLYVRLEAADAAAAEATKHTKMSTIVLVLIIGVGVVLLLVGFVTVVLVCCWKRKKRPTRAAEAAPIGILGTLLDGQAIAVKRLLKSSARGIQGFTNEVQLITSVQHINLVQVLGYCFEGDEMLIVFEFLENSSLDTYIFGYCQMWRNWKEGKGLEMVDPVIVDSSSTPEEVLRCVQIGLLCVQDSAEDRPAMSSVILMLTSERTQMDQPRPPGFCVLRSRFEIGSSSTNQPNQGTWTVPEVTNSLIEGR
ncbi:unnamed protein product [Thlaspi arvense]|uniref:Apple domain-containing protein n=1 Tax=Thlaspi arvense TaxID=13288 RepID=A0AAU9T9X8_THLAR|nr:unnamed protein product [Thlaspi arvense]